MTLKKKALENIVGKGENAGSQHFLLFPQCFIPFSKQISMLDSRLFCHVQVFLVWASLKDDLLVKINLNCLAGNMYYPITR